MEQSEHIDWALITKLGGPVRVAELLGLPKEGGVQRVQNWKHRGIPASVKVQRPDLFMPGVGKQQGKSDQRGRPGAPEVPKPASEATQKAA